MTTKTVSPQTARTAITALDAALTEKLADLALPLLEEKGFKDPRSIAKILRLALEHEISTVTLSHLTGLSEKTLRFYSQAKTSSGRPFRALRVALGRVKVPVRGTREVSMPRAAAVPKVAVPKAKETETAPRRGRKPREVAPAPVAPVVAAPVAPPTIADRGVEVREDGSIALVIRPGDPSYAETLRSLLTRAA